MAIVYNPLLGEISGCFGPAVFKKYKDKIVLCPRPLKGSRRKVSAKEQAQRDRFKAASDFSKVALLDRKMYLEYTAKARPGRCARNILMQEILTKAPHPLGWRD